MTTTPTADTTLGQYIILREIARSNDIVYEGIDPLGRRRVAIKELMLPPQISPASRKERIERFSREARAMGALNHPNIVHVFDVAQQGDRHYLVMEFLRGQSLRQILKMRGALPLQEAMPIAQQICDALAYAHSHSVIHRDIKPENIMIEANGQPKLMDFGIARIINEPGITTAGQMFGTPSYMSPEQILGKPVDHRGDIFALGVTIYEMVTGRKPFTGDSPIAITFSIMQTAPDLTTLLPPPLRPVLERALAKKMEDRYQSAAEMGQALRAVALPSQAPPVAAPAPLAPSPAPVQAAAPRTAAAIAAPVAPAPVKKKGKEKEKNKAAVKTTDPKFNKMMQSLLEQAEDEPNKPPRQQFRLPIPPAVIAIALVGGLVFLGLWIGKTFYQPPPDASALDKTPRPH